MNIINSECLKKLKWFNVIFHTDTVLQLMFTKFLRKYYIVKKEKVFNFNGCRK